MFSIAEIQTLSRREFLKLLGSGMFSLGLFPGIDNLSKNLPGYFRETDIPRQGRVAKKGLGIFSGPSYSSKLVKNLQLDQVYPISKIVVGDPEPSYNRVWYELDHEGYAYSGGIQPVENSENPVVKNISSKGSLAVVTVPYTEACINPYRPYEVSYHFYYGSTFWVTEILETKDGKIWYRTPDDNYGKSYYANARHFHIVTRDEVSPLSPDVPEDSKRIEIRLDAQMVIAYEENKPVFMTRASTGAKFETGDYATPPGQYFTSRKRPSRHMTNAETGAAWNIYDLPGVPWVSYLTESGISFHGTYWHNDFGKPHSHGCINLPTDAALWIYRWSNPSVPISETIWAGNGTQVDVMY